MRIIKIFWLLLFLGTFYYQGNAQSIYSLQIKSIDSSNNKAFAEIIKQNPYKKSFSNQLQRIKELQTFLFNLYEKGYIAASIDSITNDSLNQIAYLNLGAIYHWAKIEKGNVDEGILSETGFREKVYFGKIFNQMQVRNLEEKILNYCENNGFPFASIKLDSVNIEGDNIHAKLALTKNILVKVDRS